MGREYKAALQERIRQLGGGENLRVYIRGQGISPHYRQHLEETFRDEGVRFVATPGEANFVFHGHGDPTPRRGQVAAFFRGDRMAFVGEL